MTKIIDYKKLNSESEDDLFTFYAPIDEEYLTKHADKITPNSFVYLYALSDEERALVDEIRSKKGLQRVLRKKDSHE